MEQFNELHAHRQSIQIPRHPSLQGMLLYGSTATELVQRFE